jgi:hypothetical protein
MSYRNSHQPNFRNAFQATPIQTSSKTLRAVPADLPIFPMLYRLSIHTTLKFCNLSPNVGYLIILPGRFCDAPGRELPFKFNITRAMARLCIYYTVPSQNLQGTELTLVPFRHENNHSTTAPIPHQQNHFIPLTASCPLAVFGIHLNYKM